IQVSNILDQVFFIVTEKDDILGQVNVPITSLQGNPGRNIRSPLQPHKKCSHPKGDLIYQCYISQYRPAGYEPKIMSGMVHKDKPPGGLFKHRLSLANSPVINLKNRRESKTGSKLSTLNKKFSKSIQDIFSFGKSHHEEESGNKGLSKSGFQHMSIGTGLDSSGKVPVIVKVSPSRGLIEGGTRLTVEGQHLGFSKADILELSVCECDCVESVEYESSSRIYVKTKPSLPGKGDVVIETESGGIGCLRNAFMYCEELIDDTGNPFDEDEGNNPFDNDEEDEVTENRTSFVIGDEDEPSPLPSPSKKEKMVTLPRAGSTENIVSQIKKKTFLKHKRRASEGFALNQLKMDQPVSPQPSVQQLKCQIEKLKLENISLKEQNKDMKAYIDRLVTKVIQYCPEALESLNA
ncbi:hypothetical protein FSP39_018887, partial [Pinctada imbricata]